MNTYGTPENPFPELPPAASFYSVHWGGVKAVKWKPSSALSNVAALAMADSATGTMSMWLKFFDDFFYDILAFSDLGMAGFDSSNAFLRINAGGYIDELPSPGPIETSLRLWMQAQHDVTDPPRPGMFYLDDLRIADFEKWYHIYMEWDNNVGHCVLKINGATVPAYEYPGDVYLTESHTGPPFTTYWSQSAAGSLTLFDTLTSGPGYSIAEFWLEAGVTGVGVDKFLAASTNEETGVTTYTPKGLGDNGEKPLTPPPTEEDPDPTPVKPDFYFSRRGEPDSFLINRGTAGDFALTGDTPSAEPTSPTFTIPGSL